MSFLLLLLLSSFSLFFFNGTAPTGIYTLSLHGALPILDYVLLQRMFGALGAYRGCRGIFFEGSDPGCVEDFVDLGEI